MKDRIKKLRKSLGLTQQEFANRLGISRGNIATYETRDGNPGSSVINLMCREFNVSEEWLRTGNGEMFAPEPEFNLEEYAKQRGVSDLEKEILRVYFDLDVDIRNKLVQHFKEHFVPQKSTTDTDDRKEPS